ncbi:putative non-specific serine/threonine protein kinase [Helianthus annuus]|nr:putative non-specific serine/threonine protein kinase [Helianthus annuus]KAJ0595946.1 putative non-specific serine/threonine protein kinase [Helianthus annuus]
MVEYRYGSTYWLPKVLPYALYQADGHILDCALQFYRDQTGSDKKEIFGAALPALLDELICSVDVDDSVDNSIRLICTSYYSQQVHKPFSILKNADFIEGTRDFMLPCMIKG